MRTYTVIVKFLSLVLLLEIVALLQNQIYYNLTAFLLKQTNPCNCCLKNKFCFMVYDITKWLQMIYLKRLLSGRDDKILYLYSHM